MSNHGWACNEAIGRRMRHCEFCGVGLGIMTHEQWMSRYVWTDNKCPSCGYVAAVVPDSKKQYTPAHRHNLRQFGRPWYDY